MFDIRQDDLSGEATRALLALHLAGMQANSPPDQVSALHLSGLQTPQVTVWTVWIQGEIAGVGALKMLSADAAEIKSMRTHPDHLRKGVASAMLTHLIAEARRRSVGRLSLETGSGPAFEPALTLYRSRGFVQGAVFSDYVATDFNQFLHMTL
jgi:putative acetyltransferase